MPATQQEPIALTPNQAFALAEELQGQGRLAEAEQLLRRILAQQPGHAFALNLLGVIAFQVGKLPQAAELMQAAIRQQADVALFHANLSEVCRQLRRLDEAIAHGERAVELAPALVMAHSNLGLAYLDRQQPAEAEACHRRALLLEPHFAPSLNSMGCIKRAQRQHAEAISWFRQAAAANPRYLEPLNNLGALLLEQGEVGQARAALQQALQLNPNYPEALCNLGGVLLETDNLQPALEHYQNALALRPDYVEAQMGLARALQLQGRLVDAEREARVAVQVKADSAKAHALLAGIGRESGQLEVAALHGQRALELDPENQEALVGVAQSLTETGDLAAAGQMLERAISLQDNNLGAHLQMTQLRKIRPGDATLTALRRHHEGAASLPSRKAISLDFALGKALDDIKDHEGAFRHFVAGNRRKRESLTYDADRSSVMMQSISAIFSRDTLAALRGSGHESTAPIFVLGMPRSGTTLTEQIIASHPDVYGAGELDYLLQIVSRRPPGAPEGAAFPDNLRTLDRTTLAAWGADYVARLSGRAPQARRITDKMPSNFLVLGLIHVMLPQARIIHVRRNPVDNCLSCFTNLFQSKLEYTYDLQELGRYYVDYARLMDHWRMVLPAGAFMDIDYEDIVADQESAARRLLSYCGLEWNSACLDFHNSQRPVLTASLVQVRQPLYQSSVARWRRYEPYLGPLLETLGDLRNR